MYPSKLELVAHFGFYHECGGEGNNIVRVVQPTPGFIMNVGGDCSTIVTVLQPSFIMYGGGGVEGNNIVQGSVPSAGVVAKIKTTTAE